MQIKQILFGALSIIFSFGSLSAQAQEQYASKGIASYYSKSMHGRMTSSGERFDMNAMTCAHRTLPFGTWLNVRDVKTGAEVQVRVTDRGPFGRGRVVDLSYGAAEKLGIIARGIANVEVTALTKVPVETEGLDNDKETQGLPQLQLFDPASGKYYAMAEYEEREHSAQAQAAAKAKPRYRVMKQRLTARANRRR